MLARQAKAHYRQSAATVKRQRGSRPAQNSIDIVGR
jgi:hypothetical protein